MATGAAQQTYTPAEYLQLERADEWKSEYLNGQVVPMPHVSVAHCAITGNVGYALATQLRRSPIEVLMSRMRVKVCQTGLYTYPDVVVAAPPIQLEDAYEDTLLNPVLIVEVLSPSTEAYDRGEKLGHYRRLESLQACLLVAQDTTRVERYERQGDQWIRTEYGGLDEVVPVAAIGCALRLRDVHERVALPADESETTGGARRPGAANGGE
jgi:Uma2 family endonuclease